MSEGRKSQNKHSFSSDGIIGLAAPGDRLAAFVLDCVLLLPLVQLLQAPLKKWLLESLIFYKGTEAPLYEFINSLIFLTIFICYFSFLTYWRGQTLGQLFFRLKVISYNGHLNVISSLLRSVFIVLELFLLGLPFLAIFTHSLRRPLHDRVADTIVISEAKPSGFPSFSEKLKVQALGFSLVVFLLLFGVVYKLVQDESATDMGNLVFDSKSCERTVEEVDDSLPLLIELFMVKELHSECLFKSARRSIWANENIDLAHFSMALSLEFDSETSDQYFAQACLEETESPVCLLVKWLRSKAQVDQANDLLEITMVSGQEDFVKIYAASFFKNHGLYKEVEEVLNLIDDNTRLQPLIASLSFHSLLGQGLLSEAYWLLKTHRLLSLEDLVAFSDFEIESGNIGQQEHREVLEFFFPGIGKEKGRRGLASTNDWPQEIIENYKVLKEDL